MLGSIGVMAGALIIMFTGWVDSLVAVAIGCWVLPRTWSLLRQSLNVLLEGVPEGLGFADVSDAIARVPGVVSVHDLHVWSITSGKVSLTVQSCPTSRRHDCWSSVARSDRCWPNGSTFTIRPCRSSALHASRPVKFIPSLPPPARTRMDISRLGSSCTSTPSPPRDGLESGADSAGSTCDFYRLIASGLAGLFVCWALFAPTAQAASGGQTQSVFISIQRTVDGPARHATHGSSRDSCVSHIHSHDVVGTCKPGAAEHSVVAGKYAWLATPRARIHDRRASDNAWVSNIPVFLVTARLRI